MQGVTQSILMARCSLPKIAVGVELKTVGRLVDR